MLFLLRAGGFSRDEWKDLLQQVHDQAQDPEGQKGSSHADYHHGESEGPFGVVHVVLSERRRARRTLSDYIGNRAERPFIRGIGMIDLLPAAAGRKILAPANGPE